MYKHTFYYFLGNKKYPEIYILPRKLLKHVVQTFWGGEEILGIPWVDCPFLDLESTHQLAQAEDQGDPSDHCGLEQVGEANLS